MAGNDQAGVAVGAAGADPIPLQERDLPPVGGKVVGGAYSDNAAADHHYVRALGHVRIPPITLSVARYASLVPPRWVSASSSHRSSSTMDSSLPKSNEAIAVALNRTPVPTRAVTLLPSGGTRTPRALAM